MKKQTKRERASTDKSTRPVAGKTPVSRLPAAPRFVSPNCQLCHKPDTFAYRTMPPSGGRITRYIKCKKCGFSFKDVAKVDPSEN